MPDKIDRKIQREVESIARPKVPKAKPRVGNTVRERTMIRKVKRILTQGERRKQRGT